jgi:hypothetical protein
MTAREAFEKGTAAFNAHDIDGFAEVLADDVVFKAVREKRPAPHSSAAGSPLSRMRMSKSMPFTSSTTS